MIDGRRIAKTLAKTLAYFQKWFPAFAKGKRELRKIVPLGNTGGDIGTIAGPWESMRGLEERLAATSTTLELKAVETSEQRQESSAQVAKSPSRRYSAGDRPCPRIGRGLSGWRCLLRAATGDQHTPQTADRKFGADSKGVVDFSSDLLDLCSKHLLRSIF